MNLQLWFNKLYIFGLTSRKIIILILLPLMATMSEVFGLGIFLPVFQYVRLEGDLNALVEDSSIWQHLIDIFLFFSIEPSLGILLFIAFFLFLFRQLLNYIRLVYTTVVTQQLVQIQRRKLFDMYIGANSSYHDKNPVGNLVNIIVQEVNGAVSGLMGPLELIIYIIMLIGYLAVLSILSWEMTLFASVALLISSFVPKVWIAKSRHVGVKLVNANTLMSGFLIGRLKSPRLVRLSGTEAAEKQEFLRLISTQRKHLVSGSILKSKTDSVVEPIIIALSFIFLYFSFSVFHLQVEVIGLYLVVLMRLMPTAKSILMKVQSIKNSMGSIEILESRLDEMSVSIEKDNGLYNLRHIEKSILMKRVSYHYPGKDLDVFKDVEIEFKSGEMAAIIGPSGSGKSTLIDLIPRLRLPTHGKILIDGEGVERYKLKSLRKMIAYTPQSPQIFNGTIRSHILYGGDGATNNDLLEAVQLSGLEDFVSQLPYGLDTEVGEDAIQLSGGQRQRLDLARALISKAPVLILDEPTSGLDAESANTFKKSLRKIRQTTNTMIIIVAHNLASISDADQIIVLNKGVVESIGNHESLLKENGWYSKAWKLQNIPNNKKTT